MVVEFSGSFGKFKYVVVLSSTHGSLVGRTRICLCGYLCAFADVHVCFCVQSENKMSVSKNK